MTDTNKLQEAINNSGLRIGFIADKLNLSRAGLYKKITGDTRFYGNEIRILSELLKLSSKQIEDIFFAEKVDE